jgi:anti-sigma factor RsiW
MTCEELVRGEELERYVSGQLDEGAQAEVERHVFECDACAARLDDLMAMRSVLAAPQPGPPLVLPPRRASSAWYAQPLFQAAAVATLMFSAAGAIWWTRPDTPRQASGPVQGAAPAPVAAEPEPAPPNDVLTSAPAAPTPPPVAAPQPRPVDWAALARFEPPVFVALTVRGGEPGPARSDGLAGAREAYAEGRHGEAARLIDEWISTNGASTEVVFYRGVSRLATGDVDGGLSDLAAVAQSSEVPYAVEALLYTAHGKLAKQDAAGARAALERYIALDGDFTTEARRLLERVPRS